MSGEADPSPGLIGGGGDGYPASRFLVPGPGRGYGRRCIRLIGMPTDVAECLALGRISPLCDLDEAVAGIAIGALLDDRWGCGNLIGLKLIAQTGIIGCIDNQLAIEFGA